MLAICILVVLFQQFGCWLCYNILDVGTLYFGGCVPTVWMLAICILVVVFQQFGCWHSVFWWLCSNSLDAGNLYFGGCVPTVWMLALCILALCYNSLDEPPYLGHFAEEVDVPSSEELEPVDQTTRVTHQQNAIFRDFEAHQTAHCKVCSVPVSALLQA
jgi:hypothetical protein